MYNEIEQLKLDEGFRAYPYKCSEGFLTIGYGTKLPLSRYEDESITSIEGLSREDAQFLLEHRLTQYVSRLRKEKPIIYRLNENRQGVLYNMVYQLGVEGLLKFRRLWSSLEMGDYQGAAVSMRESLWARQTPKRAERLIKRMING